MKYNKITIDGKEGYYSFSPTGQIVSYYDIENNEIKLTGNEEITVIEADYMPIKK